jgi:chemotaxis protein CheX
MNEAFISAFIAALTNVMTTMAETELTLGEPQQKSTKVARGDVSGLIGMVGNDIKGSLSITFDESLALEIMYRMIGEKPSKLNDEVADMVGEITNMVCGGAKKTLFDQGYDFGLASPVVVLGKNHIINHQVDGPKIILPFSSNFGGAYMEICFKQLT